tara:strand:- start:79 stop:966 length:888 start_codon:yes stop_codon:yes gene_type:complete
MRKILFIGDSFTWGEGLELYMDKEPFISMRNSPAGDTELRSVSNYKDSEVEEWRASKRFSNYIDGFEKYVQKTNGGSFQSVSRDATQIVYENGFQTDDIVIIQIPPADRSYFHSNVFFQTDTGFPYYDNILRMSPQTDLHWYLTQKEGGDVHSYVNMVEVVSNLKALSKVMGYKDIDSYVKDLNIVLDKLSYRNTKLFFYSYCWDLMQRFNVYFIGPWGKENYESFSKCDEFKDKLIPMVYNGKQYDSLEKLDEGMADNNEIFEIAKEFPKTNNNHPTPYAHKIIGESIKKYLNG